MSSKTLVLLVPALLGITLACGLLSSTAQTGQVLPSETGSASQAASAGATLVPDVLLGAQTQAVIGTGGGALKSSDGGLLVYVPAGALTASTTLAVQPIQASDAGDVGPAYRLTPEGQTFNKPVTLTFTFSAAQLAGNPPDGVGVAFQHEDGSWEDVPLSRIDEGAHSVAVQVAHFTKFKSRIEYRLDPLAPNVLTGSTLSFNVKEYRYDKNKQVVTVPILFDVKTWSVDDVEGGDATLGTIANGSYTAPASVPKPNHVTVTAEAVIKGQAIRNLPAVVTIFPRRWILAVEKDYEQACVGSTLESSQGAYFSFISRRKQYVAFTLGDDFKLQEYHFLKQDPNTVVELKDFTPCLPSLVKLDDTPSYPDPAHTLDITGFTALLDPATNKFTFNITGTWIDKPNHTITFTSIGNKTTLVGAPNALGSSPIVLTATDGTVVTTQDKGFAGATIVTAYTLSEDTSP